MRLIDLDELLKFPIRLDTYDKKNGNEHFVFGIESVLEYAENLPIVEERRKGKWIGKPIAGYSTVRCSCCEEMFLENEGKWNYCPNCGTYMKGERKEK